jgi:hypothetical protein
MFAPAYMGHPSSGRGFVLWSNLRTAYGPNSLPDLDSLELNRLPGILLLCSCLSIRFMNSGAHQR